jgi:transcriptional regulator with XRE-family HTH domain
MEHRYIGRIIQKLREERGLTQYDLAARMNTARSTVRNIEVDDCQPTLNAIWYMEEALGLPHGELVRLSYPESERLPQEPRQRGRPKQQGKDTSE